MKKKIICFAAVSTILFVSFILYFKPEPLSDSFGKSSQITITTNEIGVRDGEPFIDSITHPDITEEQKNNLLALCHQYSYRRTFNTLFSDGSVSGLGNRLVYIFINDDDATFHIITISSTGKIAIDNKTYQMDDAKQFIEQITAILEPTDC